MRKRSSIFESTMPFLGGKRRLVDVIAPHFERETLADVFMGGGAVALEGKRMGMRVIANDIAYRSEIIGEALIENGQEKLTEEDVYALFLPTEHDGFIRSNYVPNVFIPEVAEFLDTAFANARKRTGTKRALLMLLLSRYVLSLRQYGSFQVGRKDNEMLMEGKVEELLEISSHSRGKKVLYSMAHPLALLLDLKDKINRGIFPNGQTNEAYRMDCFDFLEMLRNRGESVDTAYFDPPYFGTTVYSDHYRVLDEILAGRLGTEMDDRAFNEKGVLKSFERLFTLAEFIPRWVVSMGYNPAASSGIGGEELLRIVRKFRDADLLPVQHNWTISNIASKRGKKQDENVEYLIVTK